MQTNSHISVGVLKNGPQMNSRKWAGSNDSFYDSCGSTEEIGMLTFMNFAFIAITFGGFGAIWYFEY